MKPSLYGKNPGKFRYSTDYLQKCSEIELFIQINAIYEPLRMMEYYNKMIRFYDMVNDIETKKVFEKRLNEISGILRLNNPIEHNELIYALDYCILQTARFDTNVVYNSNGRIIETEEFKNWYENWYVYISTMDEDTLAIYRVCRYEGKGLDRFHPNKPLEKEKIIDEIDGVKPRSYQLTKKSIEQVTA